MDPGVSLTTVLRDWGRIGCLGFGGPPVHITMLRELCVKQRGWIDDERFEHGITATGLLPGPSSTQLAIYCAWVIAGVRGAIVGGLAFILPGLVMIIGLAALMLGDSPAWIKGAGAGAAAAVPVVAVHAAGHLVGPSIARALTADARVRWCLYLAAGLAAAALAGPWLVLVLIGAGLIELAIVRPHRTLSALVPWPAVIGGVASGAGLGALSWTAFKVGALSYGGGFVIVPLMQHDAVDRYGWLTDADFASAVALGQVTPGPVVHTVAAVGYGAHGLGGALLAAAVAFLPSFWFIAIGATRFEELIRNPSVAAFMAGAGPAAIGGIFGSAIPLAGALGQAWQWVLLAVAAAAMVRWRGKVVPILIACGVSGAVLVAAGAGLP